MYKNFFGFKERPFKLIPDPAYLFLSKSHEEALAHLTYAIRQGDGFVEITGEVGTGKTTLCRVFLESLDEETEVAYIVNPKLDAIQLLKSINDEFHIESGADNTKDLIDTLNRFLLEEKSRGKRVLLLIDEAQNLSMPVMEQIRLLSNLETTRSKLIQIILVGQPELGEMLDSHELRQLGQRITLRCHLRPLDLGETRDYILHRIGIAAKKQSVHFTRWAYRVIYRFSGGIPRLINIICDRALLVAFGLNQKRITWRVAKRAFGELSFGRNKSQWKTNWYKPAAIVLGACCLGLIALIYLGGEKENSKPSVQMEPAGLSQNTVAPVLQEKSVAVQPVSVENKSAPKPGTGVESNGSEIASIHTPDSTLSNQSAGQDKDSLSETIEKLTSQSREEAISTIAALWSIPIEVHPSLQLTQNDFDFFQLTARQKGLVIRYIHGGLEELEQLNLPAVLKFLAPSGTFARYMTLVRITDSKVALQSGDSSIIEVDPEELLANWSGTAYIFWQDFYRLNETISPNEDSKSVVALKMLLQENGYKNANLTTLYDTQTQQFIREFQKKNGLEVDGVVGASTKILLYNNSPGLKIPHIMNGSSGIGPMVEKASHGRSTQ